MGSLSVLIFDNFVSGGKFGMCARSSANALFVVVVQRRLVTEPEHVLKLGAVFSEAISLD